MAPSHGEKKSRKKLGYQDSTRLNKKGKKRV